VDPTAPVVVVGFGSGGSWALWQMLRQPHSVAGVVTYYGVTDLDFVDSSAPILAHLVSDDEVVGEDARVEFEAGLRVLQKPLTVLEYEGVSHGFAEPDAGLVYDEAAASAAWGATLDFLVSVLGEPGVGVPERG
jgi:dienelactone hydrolase